MMDTDEAAGWDPADAAEQYAALGWCVLPIRPGKKHPPIDGWRDAATDNLDTIRSWWGGLYRGHGVGIVTGPRSGFWVLDIDIANGKPGDDSLTALVDQHGPLPATVEAETGSGGGHLLFRWDPTRPITNGMSTRLPPGLDIRGDGGQIVAAPTIHPNGAPYQWIEGRGPWDIEIADAPEWLYRLLLAPTAAAPPPVADRPRISAEPHQGPAGPAGGPPPPAETGPADWLRSGWDWPTELVFAGWTWHSDHPGGQQWWTRPGKSPRDGHSAVLHGDGAGPLVVFSTEAGQGLWSVGTPTTDGSGVSITPLEFVAAAGHHGDIQAAARAVKERLRPTSPPPVSAPVAPIGTDPAANRHRLALLTEADLANIPPPVPLAAGWFNRNSLAVLFSPAKKGKTFVAIDLAMAVATGQPWLCGPTEPGTVVYCLGEGISGLNRRIQAWRTHHTNTTTARLHVLPHVPQLHNPVDVADFITAVTEIKPDLIVIDTLARATVGVEENSSKDMGEVIYQLDRIKESTGACVLVLHHTGKDAARGTRGSSALTGAIDTGVEVRGDTQALTLVVTHQKDGDVGEPRQFRADAVGDSIVLVPTADLSTATASTIAVMEALVEVDTGAVSTTTWKDMAAEQGIPERTFYRAVKWLTDNREVVNVGSPKRPLYTVSGARSEGMDGDGRD